MEKIIPFKQLPFRHRFMFAQVMSDPDICKLFLEKLLKIEIDHIEYIDTEKNVENSSRFHGVRLDVYLKDGTGTIYNIEMQVEKATLPLKRPRYYQSQVDRRLLAKGCSYQELPDTFIIFVCDFDYFGAGLAVYERESRIKGTGIPYEDGTHVYILNSRYKKVTVSGPFWKVWTIFAPTAHIRSMKASWRSGLWSVWTPSGRTSRWRASICQQNCMKWNCGRKAGKKA